MTPALIISAITAAIPLIQAAITVGEAIGADVSAHKTLLQTLQDALGAFGKSTGVATGLAAIEKAV